MEGPTFTAPLAGEMVIAAPHASHGGTINIGRGDPTPNRPKPFSTVPFRQDLEFVERPSITTWLRERLAVPASRAALVGLGGIGKSQLAIQYAHELRQSSPQTYVFWVHASTVTRFENAYRTIADRLELPGRENPQTSVLGLVRNWLCNEENGQWLMVIDNADDVSVFHSGRISQPPGPIASMAQQSLDSFLPQSNNGKILITSRSMHAAERLTGDIRNVLPMQAMDEAQALQLLRNKLGEMYDQTVSADLLRALEYLPLTITQAAACILRRAPRMSPSLYLDQLRGSNKQKIGLLKKEMADLRRDTSASNSVVTTWQITFEDIRRERQSAADLLAFMSFFNSQGIPEWMLRRYQRSKRRGLDETEQTIGQNDGDSADERTDEEFEDDLDILRSYSLIAATTQNGTFEMHSLVQLCTQVWVSLFDDMEAWKHRFLWALGREYPPGTYENWATCRTLGPHLESVIEEEPTGAANIECWATLLVRMGRYKCENGKYEEAERILRRALIAREKTLGDQHPDTLTCLAYLALVFRHQGKYKEGEEISRHVLLGRKVQFGEEHPWFLQSLDFLALVLQAQSEYEVEELYRRGLFDVEAAPGKQRFLTLAFPNTLAIAVEKRRRYEEAEVIYRRSFEGKKALLGEQHPNTLSSLNNLATVIGQQGRYVQAETMLRRAFDERKIVLGERHPDTLASLNNLGTAMWQQSKYAEAEDIYRKVLDDRISILGEHHPYTLSSLDSLATAIWQQGRCAEAEHMLRRVVDERKIVLGEQHPSTIKSLQALTLAMNKQAKDS